MASTSRTTTAPRSAKLPVDVRRTVALAALATAALAAGIGTAALSLSFGSGSGEPTPVTRHVGDRYFSEPMFRPARHANTRDTWYLEQRGSVTGSYVDLVRDRWYRE